MAKKAYIGIPTEVPIYEIRTITIDSEAVLLQYFTKIDDEYAFMHTSNGRLQSNNAGIDSSIASTTLRAKNTIQDLCLHWEVSSEEDYDYLDIRYIHYDSSGNESWINILSNASGTTSGDCGPITLNPGDDLEFIYSKDYGTNVNNDCGIISNIHWDETIQTGTTIKSFARNIKNIYLGINNIATPIIRAYVGVGGKARPFWGWSELTYYGAITSLRNPGYYIADSSISDYAIFGGGNRYYEYNHVDAYNNNLVQTPLPNLAQGRGCNVIGGTFENCAIFAGGNDAPNASNGSYYATVSKYNNNLTRSTFSLSQARSNGSSCSTNSHLFIAGGNGPDTGDQSKIMDIYDTTFTRVASNSVQLVSGRYLEGSMGTADTYAIYYDPIQCFAYNDNLTLVEIAKGSKGSYNNSWHAITGFPSLPMTGVKGTTFNNQAIFIGGTSFTNSAPWNDPPLCFSPELTKTVFTRPSDIRISSTVIPVDDRKLLVAGGTYEYFSVNHPSYKTVDSYNKDGTLEILPEMAYGRYGAAGGSVGDFAIIAGGHSNSDAGTFGTWATVEAYKTM